MTTNTIDLSDSDIPYNYEYNTKDNINVDLILTNIYYQYKISSMGTTSTGTSHWDGFFTVTEFFSNKPPHFDYIKTAILYNDYVFDFTTASLYNGIYELVFFIDSLDMYGCIKFLKNDNGLNLINSNLNNVTMTSTNSSIQILFQCFIANMNGSASITHTESSTLSFLTSLSSDKVLKYKINKI